MTAATERLHKFLARSGVASRRAAEHLIESGRVSVNDTVVTRVGTSIDPTIDRVRVDGNVVRPAADRVTLMLNKPVGVISTASDPRGRQTVVDLVPSERRLYPVGRLDWDSEGLILLTDDGDLALRLTHPRTHVEKEYVVDVVGVPSAEELASCERGLVIDGERLLPVRAERVAMTASGARLRVVLTQGRNRQIRRMFESLGYPVTRLVRVRIGGLRMGELPSGQWRILGPAQLEALGGRR